MRPDVKVLSTRWVDVIYKHWISGEDIDPLTYEAEHRFPVLYELKISVTGIADGIIYIPVRMQKLTR